MGPWKSLLLTVSLGSGLAATCDTTTQTGLQNCIVQARTNLAITRIRIGASISCATCSYDFSNFNRGAVEITSSSPSAALVRTANAAQPIIKIHNSSQLTFKRFKIDATSLSPADRSAISYTTCPPSVSQCTSSIVVSSSTDLTFDEVTLNGGKPMHMEFSGSKRVTIKNSKFTDAWMFGIWFTHDLPFLCYDFIIFNNTFGQNRANSILYAVRTNSWLRNTISGNTFYGNHYNAAFDVCSGPCSGGQLAIENNTQNLDITGNIIRDGKMIPAGVVANGIEFAADGISNVTISGNQIFNNTGWGIVKNDPTIVSLQNVVINNNLLYENALGSFAFAGASFNGFNTPRSITLQNGGVVTTYSPWVVWLSGTGLRNPTTNARLFTNGALWGQGTGYSIPTSTSISFYLPANLTSDNCNLNSVCTLQIELFDQSAMTTISNPNPNIPTQTYAISNKVGVVMPAYNFVISAGGVVTSYSPWVVWLSTEGVTSTTTCKLYANGVVWPGANGYSIPSSTAMSFSLPSNFAPNQCNLGRPDCLFEVQLVLPNGGVSPKFQIFLPAA